MKVIYLFDSSECCTWKFAVVVDSKTVVSSCFCGFIILLPFKYLPRSTSSSPVYREQGPILSPRYKNHLSPGAGVSAFFSSSSMLISDTPNLKINPLMLRLYDVIRVQSYPLLISIINCIRSFKANSIIVRVKQNKFGKQKPIDGEVSVSR